MHKLDTLRMPEHDDGRDLCKGSRQPGYTHQNPDGTLHCNYCGWVTPEPVVTAHNPDTNHTYLTWEELVEKESSGYVVVLVSERPRTCPGVLGPWPGTEAGKQEARKAQARLRAKHRREEAPYKIHTYVRILWPSSS